MPTMISVTRSLHQRQQKPPLSLQPRNQQTPLQTHPLALQPRNQQNLPPMHPPVLQLVLKRLFMGVHQAIPILRSASSHLSVFLGHRLANFCAPIITQTFGGHKFDFHGEFWSTIGSRLVTVLQLTVSAFHVLQVAAISSF